MELMEEGDAMKNTAAIILLVLLYGTLSALLFHHADVQEISASNSSQERSYVQASVLLAPTTREPQQVVSNPI